MTIGLLAAGSPAQAADEFSLVVTAAGPSAAVATPDSGYTITDMGIPNRGTWWVTAMNKKSQVVGYREYWDGSDLLGLRAWLWDPRDGVRYLTARRATAMPADINGRGQVVGKHRSAPDATDTRAFLWDRRAGMTFLSFPRRFDGAGAAAINDGGVVVGSAWKLTGKSRAVVWGEGAAARILPPLRWGSTAAEQCDPVAVNAEGQVTGTCSRWDEDFSPELAFVWDERNGTQMVPPLQLDPEDGPGPFCRASAINDLGQVVGLCYVSVLESIAHAFVWDPRAGVTDLGTLGGQSSSAPGINNAGTVVGNIVESTGTTHAFVWDAVAGMTELGTLGGQGSYAVGINAAGTVVGSADDETGTDRAFVWDSRHGMRALPTLSPGQESSGRLLNDRGQVVGTSGNAVVLWSPRVTVAVKAVRDRTRLRVNVNPNLGASSWRVTVQKRRPDQTWVRQGVYRTQGKAETLTVNLPRGTYRAVVRSQKGFHRAVSTWVRLRS